MGLLDRASVLWGMAVAGLLAVVCAAVAPLLGLEITSMLIGLVVGLVAAGGFMIVRVLEPTERGLKALNNGTLAEDHPRGRGARSSKRFPVALTGTRFPPPRCLSRPTS